MYLFNMGHWISWWGMANKNKIALVFEGRHFTYKELNERINKLSHALREKFDIQKGDRVGCLLCNCNEFLEILMACAKIGARFVPVNIRLAPREVEHVINDSGMKVLFTEQASNSVIELGKDRMDLQHIIYTGLEYDDLIAKGSSTEPNDQAGWADDFGILYTSGTTGEPKGAVLTQLTYLTMSHHHLTGLGFGTDERGLVDIPLCFQGGLVSTFPVLHAGGTIYLEKEFEPERCLRLIEANKITFKTAVTTMWKMMANLPNFEKADLSSLRNCVVGAEPIPVSLMMKCLEKQSRPVFSNGYGLTEAGGYNMMLSPNEMMLRPDAYLPCIWNLIKIVKDNGEIAGSGEVGEIAIQGSSVMKGYWNSPEKTKETIKDGWLYTGDLSVQDEEGYYYIKGRKKELIISGGLNVYPAEVENIIAKYPQVGEAAVVGLPHLKWGEGVTAIVVARQGQKIEEKDLIKFCRENLADYKVPKAIIMESEFPRSITGKTLKRVLTEKHKDFYLA